MLYDFFFPAGVIECQIMSKHSCVNCEFLTTNVGENALFSWKHYNQIHFVCLTVKKIMSKSKTNISSFDAVDNGTRHKNTWAGDCQEADF